MKIGIIGGGNVGSSLAKLLTNAGHDVLVGSRNGINSAQDAALHGDAVVLALHYHAVADALPPLADELDGKVVVDATNPLNDDWSPLLLGQENSAAEEIARLVPNAHVVKAFNTIFADVMSKEKMDRAGQKITAFVASDEDVALSTVAKLADDMGFASVTISKLSAARYLEAMAHLNIELAIGQDGGTNAALIYHRAS
ncbi:MAG: NAD(P)-binding domain-containing protein [Pseudomonadota bacterium]